MKIKPLLDVYFTLHMSHSYIYTAVHTLTDWNFHLVSTDFLNKAPKKLDVVLYPRLSMLHAYTVILTQGAKL